MWWRFYVIIHASDLGTWKMSPIYINIFLRSWTFSNLLDFWLYYLLICNFLLWSLSVFLLDWELDFLGSLSSWFDALLKLSLFIGLGEVCKKGTAMAIGIKIFPPFFNHMYWTIFCVKTFAKTTLQFQKHFIKKGYTRSYIDLSYTLLKFRRIVMGL